MQKIHLKIITPQKIALEADVNSVSAPTLQGEITVLPRHVNLFTLLVEGIIKFKSSAQEKYLAIGGGYLETDGEEVNILVSRVYGQDEIYPKLTEQAIEDAKNTLKLVKAETDREQAMSLLRRSLIDLKLLKRRKHHPASV